MPHADLIPEGLSDPDWGRVGVRGPEALGAPQLGDPTRWGANITFRVLNIVGPQIFRSGQIIHALTRDGYSRPWGIAGTLSFPQLILPLPNNMAGNSWIAALSITMGVGQTQIIHNVDLRATVAADDPFYWSGDPTLEGQIGPFTVSDTVVAPFVIPAGIVGSMISIQLLMGFTFNPAPGAEFNFGGAMLLTPFAAGEGL